MSNELEKKEPNKDLQTTNLDLGVQNASVPTDYYSQNPCLIGFLYVRVMVDGNILPCCVAKHPIGDLKHKDWREVWHSGAYESFRRKMARIHLEQFHRVEPEWYFCQQCSHLPLNQRVMKKLLK